MSSNVDICPSCKSVLPFPDEKPLHSPLSPFLGTNHIPSDSERRLGEEFVAQLSAEIANVEDQISRLQRFRNRLELYRKEHSSVLSKFRMLPIEIIASIFVILVNSLAQRKEPSTTSGYFGLTSPKAMDIPFTLTSVCQQWRMIATSTPSLWINIVINMKSLNFMGCVAQTTQCLSRSDNHPLNIDMDLRGAWYTFEKAPLRWLAEVCGSFHRCREARIVMYDGTGMEHLREMTPSRWDLPELEFLSLGSFCQPGMLSLPPIRAPQLAEVEFCHLYIDNLRWRQFRKLRKLSLLQVKLSQTLDALAECGDLLHLRCQLVDDVTVTIPHFYPPTPPTPTRFVHYTLVSLETFDEGRKGDYTHLTSILQYLELPALRDLTLAIRSWKDHPDEYITAHERVWDFISVSQCMLEKFALERVMVSKAEWERYAPLLSTLTVLKLTENRFCIYNDVLESLAVVGNEAKVVLPQLQRLEYNFHARASRDSDYDTIFSLLAGIVKSRWEDIGESSAVHRMESIEVRGARPERRLESFASFRALDALRQKGFDLGMHFL